MNRPLQVATRVDEVSRLLETTDLRPGPVVNRAFGELVDLSLTMRSPEAEEVIRLLGTRVEVVRRLCADGESALESSWSDRVVAADDPWDELERFPYLDNYRDLVALEVGALASVKVQPRTVVMLGSGPLPLTGVVLVAEHGREVVLVDRDEASLARGEALVAALGLVGVSSLAADVEQHVPDLRSADLVVLAALVGADGLQKQAALRRIAREMRPGAHLVVRSAAGLRELLYPPASVTGVDELDLLLELHPHHDVVNSVLVARRAFT